MGIESACSGFRLLEASNFTTITGGAVCMKKILAIGVFLMFLVVCSEVSAQSRIRFARGRTSASVSGGLSGGGTRTFVLGARYGQYLSANVSSANGCVKFTGGSTSSSFTTNAGDNYISVTNYCSRYTSFVLTVSINYGSD